jgi:phosphopantetheine adenylyltransferase/dephospho-CoA kinase
LICCVFELKLPFSHDKPYVIGLTGGLASGKSSVRKRLEKFGAATIDCDQLGHRTYEPNSNAYGKLVEIFGENILDADKRIDRRKLGSIVFANKDELKKLTDVVWPEIKDLIQIEIGKLFEAGIYLCHCALSASI